MMIQGEGREGKRGERGERVTLSMEDERKDYSKRIDKRVGRIRGIRLSEWEK
jgi:hypothetical protein